MIRLTQSSFIFSCVLLMCGCSNQSAKITGPYSEIQPPNLSVSSTSIKSNTPKVALTEFNQSSGYSVSFSGRLLNTSNESLTYIKVQVNCYNLSGTIVGSGNTTTDVGGYSFNPLTPQTETYFDGSVSISVDGDQVDLSKTTVNILINDVVVDYEDRTAGVSESDSTDSLGIDTTPFYDRYDFRWNMWGDTKDQVQDAEPNHLEFIVDDGGNDARVEMAYTDDTFEFSDSTTDSVNVTYSFVGGRLVTGAYAFSHPPMSSVVTMVKDKLTEQYGDSFLIGTFESWQKNDYTAVSVLASDSTNTQFLYYHEDYLGLLVDAWNYNDLPLRPVVPE